MLTVPILQFVILSTHYSSIASSYSKADVVAQEYRAGGLVGCNTDNSTITDSLSHGDVEGNLNIGGLAGEQNFWQMGQPRC